MKSEDQKLQRRSLNEDLGHFLPTSIIPEILNDSDMNSSKLFNKSFLGQDYLEPNDPGIEGVNYYSNRSQTQLFNPKTRYNSHSGINQLNQNYPNFANYSIPTQYYNTNINNFQKNRQWQNTNSMGFNQNYNTNPYMINQQRPQMMNKQYYSPVANNSPRPGINSPKYFGSDTDYCSSQDSFSNFNIYDSNSISNPLVHNLEQQMNAVNLNNPKKKTISAGNLSQFTKHQNHNHQHKQKNINKRNSLFNNKDQHKKKEEEEEDLQKFIENLDMDLHKFICSQKGSRVMQRFLNKITPENLNYFINALGFNITALMTDLYGNYFCQKLVQSCSAEQRITILNFISADIVNISYDNSGTHALQSLLEIINLHEEEQIILKAIRDNMLDMAYDNNATHVIQKIIVCISEEKRDLLNQVVLENLKSLSLDSNGICVVKKLVNTNKSEELKAKILDEIYFNCLEIVQSPFGNYAIQHILEEWEVEYCKKVVGVIQQNVISLSMQKYSSNVVERCLEMSQKADQKNFIKEIMNPCKILSLLKNKYGSFVLQKTIAYLDSAEKAEMKTFLQNKINVTSSKEKIRVNAFFDLLSA